LVALLDTPIVYAARHMLMPYLGLEQNEEATHL
jgi:hypothetical protein